VARCASHHPNHFGTHAHLHTHNMYTTHNMLARTQHIHKHAFLGRAVLLTSSITLTLMLTYTQYASTHSSTFISMLFWGVLCFSPAQSLRHSWHLQPFFGHCPASPYSTLLPPGPAAGYLHLCVRVSVCCVCVRARSKVCVYVCA